VEGAGTFLNRLLLELRNSLLQTFGLFDSESENAVTVLARLLDQLVISLLLIAIFVLIYRSLRFGLRFFLRRFRLNRVEQPLTSGLRYTVSVLAALAVLSQFGVSDLVTGRIARASVVGFLFYLGWLLSLRFLTRGLTRYQLDRSILQLLRNVASVLIFAFGIASVLSQFGVNIVSLVTGLGVVGIAVGFAAQDTLSNLIAGITLLIERPFHIGEWVQINGQVGKVQEITLRNTRLVTRDNIYTVIPNSSVSSSDIINYSAGGPLRLQVSVGIAYKESVKAAREALMPVIMGHEKVMRAPEPSVRVEALADSSVNLLLIFWIERDSIEVEPKIRADILENSKNALDTAGIEIPFPHLQLFIDEAKGLTEVVQPPTLRHSAD
jgi:small conductance mechanosensitive channel